MRFAIRVRSIFAGRVVSLRKIWASLVRLQQRPASLFRSDKLVATRLPLFTAILATFLFGFAASRGVIGTEQRVSVFQKTVPQGAADLRDIEKIVREVAKKVIPCTVGIQVGPAMGSGVIISEDGYVLTAGHVAGGPGRDALIRLPDGKLLQGKTLGIHTVADAGLVKISTSGKWPHVPLISRGDAPKPGDWCLATGHPRGFQTERSAPFRLGRVIDVTEDVLRSDCPVTGGDSGGPLFDIEGRVIGIHSRISQDVTLNLHAPVLACVEVWEQLEASKIVPTVPSSRFLDRLDIDRDGKLSRAELPDGFYRRVFDRFANKYQLDPHESHPVEQLTKTLGWHSAVIPEFGRRYSLEGRRRESLRRSRYVRGSGVRQAFADVVAPINESTVSVESQGKRIALGTVVGADGWILSKATQMSGDIECRFHDGRTLPAHVVDTDKQYDLAMLRVKAKELTPAKWSSTAHLAAGSWLITPDVNGVGSVGVISVAARKIVGIPGVLGVEIVDPIQEPRIANVFRNSGAATAGMQVNDLITHISGREVHNIAELRETLKESRAGDVVEATIIRDARVLKLKVTLGAPEDVFLRFGRNLLNGPLSQRRDGFPRAVQHDSVLDPTLCGGPIVDVNGKAVGINIARADRIATYAAPSEAVKSVIQKLMHRATVKVD